MALPLIYQMFSKLLGAIVLRTRSDTAEEIEILVLCHQLSVLRRRRVLVVFAMPGHNTSTTSTTSALHNLPHPLLCWSRQLEHSAQQTRM